MDSSIAAIRPDVVSVQTTPRPTATPIRVQFSEVLAGGARALVRSAQTVLRALPGSPLMAVAMRGGASGVPAMNVLAGTLPASTQASLLGAPIRATTLPSTDVPSNPEGPGGSSAAGSLGTAAGILGTGMTGVGAAAGTSTATPNDGSMEGTLAQDQQMNLYYLQIQEQVNAQNRTFSALSNVLEVEHNTAKTAIGNIH
jgi:hypothetical protein